jgi:ABC-type antimicrobial peptide transport system permease subunit
MVFITATAIGYTQYKSILSFDLGFNTANVLNIRIQGNNADNLVKDLAEIPEITNISRSMMVTSVGSYWGSYAKYKDTQDSTLLWYNKVDENYLPLHGHKLAAGTNFISRPKTKKEESEIIVNEQVLKRFDIGNSDPEKAIGEVLDVEGQKLTIVGVLKDFHYGKVENKIEPVAFMAMTEKDRGFVNVKVESNDIITTMAKIESAWKKFDKIHPIEARFYNDDIEKAYSGFSAMIKIIGFLSFLAISIASMGLFGMVVFTTETRLKEISIRKVMGASSGNLVLLLSRGFLILLSISAAVAIPLTYFFFEGVVLTNFPYHNPIQITELFAGLVVVLVIAVIMIGSQTMKAARSNPAEILKSE